MQEEETHATSIEEQDIDKRHVRKKLYWTIVVKAKAKQRKKGNPSLDPNITNTKAASF